ncbi:hypothetical protein ACLB2K_048204 [Fragaria x ananassa]
MSDTFCQVCKCFTEVVSDHASGDTSCSECGTLVVDETSEWVPDPTREPVSPVRLESGVSRSNGATEEEEEALPAPRQKRRGRPKRPPYESIAEVANRLGLGATIKSGDLTIFPLVYKDRASDIYKKVIDQKPLKYKTPAAVVAACVYVACRQESNPRTVKVHEEFSKLCGFQPEMCSANGAKTKEVVRVKDFIMKYLVTEGQEIVIVHAADFLRHFCSVLGMSNIEVMAAQETVKNSEELAIRRSPISLAAVVIYIIAQLSNDKKAIRDVALVTRVAEATIRNSYKDVYPHLSEVIPTWFAKEKDLKQLPRA